MPEAGVGDELGVGELGDGCPEQIEPGEGVALAGQKERRAADRRPVLGPEPRLGSAGTVEGIRETDEATDLRPVAGCDEAGDAAAEGVTAENDEAIGGQARPKATGGRRGGTARQRERLGGENRPHRRPQALGVALDIRPGANPNAIGRHDRGVLPVALLTTPAFDAADADPATLTLGDGTDPDTPPARRPNGTPMAALEDADGDGDLDLVLHFRLPELRANGDLTDTTTELTLRGQTRDGTPIRGTDTVRLVP